MTTTAELISETRQHLMTGHPDRVNVLNASIDASQTTLVLKYEAKGIAEGSTIVIDLEEMHVISLSTTGGSTTVTVVRGWNNSTQASHQANAIIYINPQFSSFRIFKALNNALDNLSAEGLFRILTTSNIAANSIKYGYNIGSLTNFLGVWRISQSQHGPSDQWLPLRPEEWWLDLVADTTTFASGQALFLKHGVHSGLSIRIAYKAGFSYLSALNNDVLATTGLHTEAHDVLALRAAMVVLAGREVKRSFLDRQPEPRRQEEVPPGSANQAMLPIVKLYEDRLDAEIRRLKRRYPGSV